MLLAIVDCFELNFKHTGEAGARCRKYLIILFKKLTTHLLKVVQRKCKKLAALSLI